MWLVIFAIYQYGSICWWARGRGRVYYFCSAVYSRRDVTKERQNVIRGCTIFISSHKFISSLYLLRARTHYTQDHTHHQPENGFHIRTLHVYVQRVKYFPSLVLDCREGALRWRKLLSTMYECHLSAVTYYKFSLPKLLQEEAIKYASESVRASRWGFPLHATIFRIYSGYQTLEHYCIGPKWLNVRGWCCHSMHFHPRMHTLRQWRHSWKYCVIFSRGCKVGPKEFTQLCGLFFSPLQVKWNASFSSVQFWLPPCMRIFTFV